MTPIIHGILILIVLLSSILAEPTFAEQVNQPTMATKANAASLNGSDPTLPLALKPSQHGELSISALSDNLYLHESFMQTKQFGFVGSNGLIFVDGKDAYLIDTPWSEADTIKLVQWVEHQGLTLTASVSTHSHEDRTAGVGYLNSIGVDTYASTHTNQLLEKAGHPQTKQQFTPGQFDFLNQKIEVYFVGAGHTHDNLVVWFPESKLLYGGCLVKSLSSKTLGYYGEADLIAWPNSIKQLQVQFADSEQVLPGHGDIGTGVLLSHTIKLLEQHAAH